MFFKYEPGMSFEEPPPRPVSPRAPRFFTPARSSVARRTGRHTRAPTIQSRLWTPSPDARELVWMRRPIVPIRGNRRSHVAQLMRRSTVWLGVRSTALHPTNAASPRLTPIRLPGDLLTKC